MSETGSRRSVHVGPRCLIENDDDECQDGLDNDGNGFVDCADFAFSRNVLVSPCRPIEAGFCRDRRDNDHDQLFDCDDPDCAVAAVCLP